MLLAFALLTALAGCAPKSAFYHPQAQNWEGQAPEQEWGGVKQQLFLIGDAGKPHKAPKEPTLQILQRQLQQSQGNGGLVFLGDNIYPRGLPKPENPKHKEAAQYLSSQLAVAKEWEGKSLFIPGNHDWDKMGQKGLEKIRRQEAFVEEYLNDPEAFIPSNGCPGPVAWELGEHTVVLAIDTQWWLHEWEKGDENDGCAQTDGDFLADVGDALKRHKNKRIVVVAHHPLFSNGLHGGHVKPTAHLFPLTEISDNLYVPLPGLGSIYAIYRTLIGSRQDIPNPRFKRMKKALLKLFEPYPDLIYASGHEHNLQYFHKREQHFVVSGAGCKQTYTTHRKKATFAYGHKGFARIDFYESGDAWLQYFVPETNEKGEVAERLAFQQHLGKVTPVETEKKEEDRQEILEPRFRSVRATGDLTATGMKRWLMGGNYRDSWSAVIDSIPAIDLKTKHGGLEIVKKGGGMQTRSLRLEAPDKKQYNLRSIEKFPAAAVPEVLRGTIGEEVIRDQISAAQPYGAFAIPPMAEAAGIYHTNPELVYLPDDPLLGEYREMFASQVYLLEERPDEEIWGDADFFGNAPDINSTSTTLEKLREDNDNYVIQPFVARNRLFDFWIGDWDRHEDQWRWGEHEDEDGDEYYEVIPRDRDQVFFFSDGFLMKVGTRKWGVRKFQGFHEDIRDIAGFGFNARHFDRSFLNEVSREEWVSQAKELQEALTDSVIAEGLSRLPKPIYDQYATEIGRKLRSRREHLVKYAEQYYEFLAQTPDIVGSDKHELFKVEHLARGTTRVRMYKLKKDREVEDLLYDRTFYKKETKEIRLYGLKGKDIFEIKGDYRGVKVRVIGGKKYDEVKQDAPKAKTYVYDKESTPLFGKNLKDRRSDDPSIHEYDRESYEFDVFRPTLAFSYNPDDGVFIGGGFVSEKQGFRKSPYASRQTVKARYAPKTSSYSLYYQGEWRKALLQSWDAVVELDAKFPSYTNFFYGLGNETEIDPERPQNYYRVRFTHFAFSPKVRKQSENERHSLSFGLNFHVIEFEENEERFASENPRSRNLIEQWRWFFAADASYVADTRNEEFLPTRGILFKLNLRHAEGGESYSLNPGEEISYTRLRGSFAGYFRLGQTSRVVLALRGGGAHNWGRYEFFQANTLGGLRNLRGYGRMRFAGRSTVYQNTELRFKLLRFHTPLFPGGLGVSAIHDVGRVWQDGESSDRWHQGYGGGLWATPLDALSLSADYTRSTEGGRVFLRLGWMF